MICHKVQLTNQPTNNLLMDKYIFMSLPSELSRLGRRKPVNSKSLQFCSSNIVFIIIMSCREHGYPWPSLVTFPYRSSPLAGLQGYIAYPHIAAECMFELGVLLLPGHMWGSIGVHHLWARPCFSSSVLHVWFV